MSDEWGPWIEHDGRGCPCIGFWVEAEGNLGEEIFKKSGFATGHPSWDWRYYHSVLPNGKLCAKLTRYRIRKPRGMELIESALQGEPVKEDA